MTKQRELYEAPTISVVEVKFEGVVCQSLDATMDGTFEEITI